MVLGVWLTTPRWRKFIHKEWLGRNLQEELYMTNLKMLRQMEFVRYVASEQFLP